MSMQPRHSHVIDNTFFVAVIAKGLGGLIELASGILLIFMSTTTLHHLLTPLSHVGLDTGTAISGSAKLFIVIYFSLRGSLRILLAICLLREQLWAYPATIVLLGAAILYQIWLLVSGHFSHALLLLTLFDMLIVGLTWIEYRKLRLGGHLSHPHL